MEFIERFKDDVELNEDVSYISSIKIINIPVNIYVSDYGQCFFFTYIENGKVREVGCGTYETDFLECIVSTIDWKGYHISVYDEDVWNALVERIKSRTGEDIDTDDYMVYNFEEMYKELEEFKGD